MNLFITAIDTDAGKTMVTGLLAKTLKDAGRNVMTAKLVQTGCTEMADDIVAHRRIMGIEPTPQDMAGDSCAYIFPFPASPHLSAQLEGRAIDAGVLDGKLDLMEAHYNMVLTEGAGGLMVPLTADLLTIDFVAHRQMPVVLVTSAKLGSINHTLLSLEACKSRGLDVVGVVFNHYPVAPQVIFDDSRQTIQNYLRRYFPKATWDEVPLVAENACPHGLFPELLNKIDSIC